MDKKTESAAIDHGSIANREEMDKRHKALKGKRGWLHQNPVGAARETRRKNERTRLRKLRDIEREERQKIRARRDKKIKKQRAREQKARMRLKQRKRA
ncbi:MAG TPA: hypothetical protein VJ248_02150 [Candidatus Udaeobacter sp.]|nr:hypothetical protein [Candidatus Udaeobacter sp.]